MHWRYLVCWSLRLTLDHRTIVITHNPWARIYTKKREPRNKREFKNMHEYVKASDESSILVVCRDYAFLRLIKYWW